MQGADPVLTVAQMRAAETAAAPDLDAMYALMQRAGAGVADIVFRISAGREVLIVCGPGNNGGDGYVAARVLRSRGANVRVVAASAPRSALARRASRAWGGPVEDLIGDEPVRPAPVFVDAVFGAGQSRTIDWCFMESLLVLAKRAGTCVAVDLPTGISSDSGSALASNTLPVHLTLAIGALKPAHILPSAMLNCGEIRRVDIGLDLAGIPVRTLARPAIPRPANDIHKYTRGMVGVIAGEMPGAARLAATAAARAGAGYVIIYGDDAGGPASLVHRPLSDAELMDDRLDAVVIGPGLGRSNAARERIDWLLRSRNLLTVILDADALDLFDPQAVGARNGRTILTPHIGEYRRMAERLGLRHDGSLDMFAEMQADREAMAAGGGLPVLVRKGSTTYVVGRNGVVVSPRGSRWLSTAGTGDVLAGTIAAMAAVYGKHGQDMVDAASAGVWLHAEAARRLKASFIADDLAHELSAVRAAL